MSYCLLYRAKIQRFNNTKIKCCSLNSFFMLTSFQIAHSVICIVYAIVKQPRDLNEAMKYSKNQIYKVESKFV